MQHRSDRPSGGTTVRPGARASGRLTAARPTAPRVGRHDIAAGLLARAADPALTVAQRVEVCGRLSRCLDEYFADAAAPGRPGTAGGGSGAGAMPDPPAGRSLHRLVCGYDLLLHERVLPELVGHGVRFPSWEELTRFELVRLRRTYRQLLHPLLTPMAVDSTRPFPTVTSLAVNIAVLVRESPDSAVSFACVTIPARLPRVVALGNGRFVPAEAVVGALLPDLFPGLQVVEHSCFRVTRGEAATVGDDGAPAGRRRAERAVTRLELERAASDHVRGVLIENLMIHPDALYPLRSSLAMGDVLTMAFGGAGAGIPTGPAPAELGSPVATAGPEPRSSGVDDEPSDPERDAGRVAPMGGGPQFPPQRAVSVTRSST